MAGFRSEKSKPAPRARVRSDIVTALGLSRPLPTCRVTNVVPSGRLVPRTQSEPFEGLLVPLQQTDAQEGPASAHATGALDLQRDECLAASVLRPSKDAHVRSHNRVCRLERALYKRRF